MGSSVSCDCDSISKDPASMSFSPGPCTGDQVSSPAPVVFEQKAVRSGSEKAIGMRTEDQRMSAKAVDPAASLPTEVLRLDGTWVNDEDKTVMGKIEGGFIVWDDIFNHAPSILSYANDGFSMELLGNTHRAFCEEKAGNLRLVWTDGEVWVRAR
eukprot:TRINITY_DN11270_c0_g1_i1.p1 TRINITY_DN11270_c0_g1~~TRINITY_DN11270_c0_g1_i1.p1  ORF type:complete len:177 (+),score=28.38 TRINITY_DN11270_c0_g1_i1:67-531(+)